jgi:CheY-like chemotaxis protein
MKKCILWIEDDYFAIKGLVRPLEREGFTFDVATSAVEGFYKAQQWRAYDVILVDLILPLVNSDEDLPEKVRSWNNEPYVGIGLLKWLKADLQVECPVLMLSVVRDPISKFHLENLGLAGYLPKRGLLPSQVKANVLKIINVT